MTAAGSASLGKQIAKGAGLAGRLAPSPPPVPSALHPSSHLPNDSFTAQTSAELTHPATQESPAG